MPVPAIDGTSGASATFDHSEAATAARLPIHDLAFVGQEIKDLGSV